MRRTPENTIQVKRPILLPRPIRSISESLNSIALIFITEMLARMLPAIVATEKTIYFKIRSPVSECFLNKPNISDPSVSLSILTSYRRKINIRQSYIKDTIKIMLRIVYLQGFAGTYPRIFSQSSRVMRLTWSLVFLKADSICLLAV